MTIIFEFLLMVWHNIIVKNKKTLAISVAIILILNLSCTKSTTSPEAKTESPFASSTDKIFLFATAQKYNANLGGRTGADQKCADALKYFKSLKHPISCDGANVRAVIGISSKDQITDLQKNYSIPNLPINIVVTLPDGRFRIDELFAGLNLKWDRLVGEGNLTLPNTYFPFSSDVSKYWMGATGPNGTAGDTIATSCKEFNYGLSKNVPAGGCLDEGTDLRCATSLLCSDYNSCSQLRGLDWVECNTEAQLICACW